VSTRPFAAVVHWIFLNREVTVRRAGIGIAAITLGVSIVCGFLMWLVDRASFPTVGDGLWFAVQTVTTVGYGDIVPRSVAGRTMGVLVMLAGTAFVAVVTASITAAFVDIARRRMHHETESVDEQLHEIRQQLASIEKLLGAREG